MSSTNTAPDAKAPWPPLWVGLAIFIFPPFGLYVLWRHPVLGRNKKWWIGACIWGVLWINNIRRPADTEVEGGPGETPYVETEKRPAPKRSLWGPTQLAYAKRVDLCDNPDKYENTEMKMEVKYEGGGQRVGGKLVSMPCTVFYGDGSFDMQFEIPSDVSQPSIQPGQYLMVTFVFSGNVNSPSLVTAVSRK